MSGLFAESNYLDPQDQLPGAIVVRYVTAFWVEGDPQNPETVAKLVVRLVGRDCPTTVGAYLTLQEAVAAYQKLAAFIVQVPA